MEIDKKNKNEEMQQARTTNKYHNYDILRREEMYAAKQEQIVAQGNVKLQIKEGIIKIRMEAETPKVEAVEQ